MLGLDSAGKSTILYKLLSTNPNENIPTIGFNVECIEKDNIKFNVWDVGGQRKIRPLWRHYYTGSQALIYVIDSQDCDRLEEAKLELVKIIRDREMTGVNLLVYANKQDLQGALSAEQIQEKLDLNSVVDRNWIVVSSNAKDGTGLLEGLEWLSKQ